MGIIGDNERWRQVGDQTQNYWRVPGETRQLLYLSLLGDTLRLAQLAQSFHQLFIAVYTVAPMESLSFPQFESRNSQVSVALFRHVANSGSLKSRIISASTTEGDLGEAEREAVKFAFIDARLVR